MIEALPFCLICKSSSCDHIAGMRCSTGKPEYVHGGYIRRDRLTVREVQLLRGLAQGKDSQEIGQDLLIAESTVKVYLSRLFQKLHFKKRLEAALWAWKNIPDLREQLLKELVPEKKWYVLFGEVPATTTPKRTVGDAA